MFFTPFRRFIQFLCSIDEETEVWEFKLFRKAVVLAKRRSGENLRFLICYQYFPHCNTLFPIVTGRKHNNYCQ